MGMEKSRGNDLASRLVCRRGVLKSLIGLGAGWVASEFLPESKLFAASPASQSGESANPSAQTIHYDAGDTQISAYLAKPKDSGKHPAILVIHDDAGLNDYIRNISNRFAAEGFVALAPELSRSGSANKLTAPDDVAKALSQLSIEKSVQYLLKAYSFLQSDPDVTSDQISSAGFGWGGWRNYLFAEAADGLRQAVMFSSGAPADGLADLQSPVLAHYAQFDFRVTGNAVWTAKTMKDLGKKFTYYVYPGVKHDFLDSASPDYDASAAKLAWTRTFEFLRTAS
jgi:carboxymethylenebutenolidase